MARDDHAVPREDFEAAVRFVADGAMHASHRASRMEALLRAVVRALAESRVLDVDAFERNLADARPVRRAPVGLPGPGR